MYLMSTWVCAATREVAPYAGDRARSPLAMFFSAWSSSTGGKIRSLRSRQRDQLCFDGPQRLEYMVAVEAKRLADVPFRCVHGIVSRLLRSRLSRKNPSEGPTRKSSSEEKPISL
jgi:hypothetical protein